MGAVLWVTDLVAGGGLAVLTWSFVTACPRSPAEAKGRQAEYRRARLAGKYVSRHDVIFMSFIGGWCFAALFAVATVSTVIGLTRFTLAGG